MDIILDGKLRFANGVVTEDGSGAGMSFVSSAEVPGAWRLIKPVCTVITATLLSVVRREFRPLVMPYGHFVNIGSARVTLIAAGPIPGGAAVLVENDGRRLLFCAGAVREPAKLPNCDVVIAAVSTASTPPERDTLADIADSARSAVRAGMVPLVTCNPFGTARQVCAALASAGLPVRVHKGVERFNRVWRAQGFDPGPATGFRGGPAAGAAVVLPSHLVGSPLESGIRHPWRIAVSRAGDPRASGPAPDQRMVLPGVLSPDDVDAVLSATKAGQAYLSGDGAQSMAGMFRSARRHVSIVEGVRQGELL